MSGHKVLTKNGYVLSKRALGPTKLNFIKKELTVKPIMHPDYASEVESFKIYKENNKSICVPRYYGEKMFGKPTKKIMIDGAQTKMKFKGQLREKQMPIAESCLKDIKNNGGGIISLPCGYGKCMIKGTQILMYDGTIKLVEDIKVGDKLMGDDSKPRKVLSLGRGREEMYDIIPTKGPKHTVNKSHILSLKYNTVKGSSINGQKLTKGSIVDIEVSDYLKLPKYYHGRGSPLRGYRVPINFRSKKIELDPYMLGYWLGDGDSNRSIITTMDHEVIKYYEVECAKHGLSLRQGKRSKTTRHDLHYNITTGTYDETTDKWSNNCSNDNYFYQQLKKLNVLNNKHFPHIYKCNSRKVRLEVLAGFIDADGHLTSNCFDICLSDEGLIDDIIFIARSLGLAAYKSECWKTCTNGTNGPKKCKCYRTNIHGDTSIIPTKIKRKQATKRQQIKDVTTYGIKVVPVGIDDYYGFEIDGNRRFLLADLTVTHNTVLALYLACQLGLKTLVVVHKTFLQNQWYDRIKQFCDANVGTIRQKKTDVEGKDIVVGMLQSISMIDYDSEIFKDFGVVIVDEAHHAPSRVFSKALQKTGCKYTIGLSATPYRSDGLTKVLFWYLGDMIYRLERQGDKNVIVKMFNYQCNDKLFVEKKQWRNGKITPSVPKMVTNMYKMDDRNKFVISIINSLKDQYERKIIILSERLEHLRILKEGVDALIAQQVEKGEIEPEEYKTANYIGKMKEYELRDSAEADIIFATYAMAAEGLDIDRLNTLVFATPKRNIVQSLGRIMRKPIKEGDIYPLVVDIVDQFSVFEYWGKKRRQYYEKKKYTVDFYQAHNDKCISVKDFLLLKNICKEEDLKEEFDIRREFMKHKYGEDHYEMEEECGFEDDPIEMYNYEPNLNTLFTIEYDCTDAKVVKIPIVINTDDYKNLDLNEIDDNGNDEVSFDDEDDDDIFTRAKKLKRIDTKQKSNTTKKPNAIKKKSNTINKKSNTTKKKPNTKNSRKTTKVNTRSKN